MTISQLHEEEKYLKNPIYEGTSMTLSQEEKYLKNPIYERTSMTQSQLQATGPNGCETSPQQETCPRDPYRMYDAVNIPSQTATQDEQTYDISHRGKVNG